MPLLCCSACFWILAAALLLLPAFIHFYWVYLLLLCCAELCSELLLIAWLWSFTHWKHPFMKIFLSCCSQLLGFACFCFLLRKFLLLLTQEACIPLLPAVLPDSFLVFVCLVFLLASGPLLLLSFAWGMLLATSGSCLFYSCFVPVFACSCSASLALARLLAWLHRSITH